MWRAGVEINNGRLVFYGLGNFLHHGTANMAAAGGCRDYSILAKVHLVTTGSTKPQVAAVEVVPIRDTHYRTTPMSARQAARRIGILNGLAAQFDNTKDGAKGVRFVPQADGSGLFCTADAKTHPKTRALCAKYRPSDAGTPTNIGGQLRPCGSSYRPALIAKSGDQSIAITSLSTPTVKAPVKKTAATPKKPTGLERKTVTRVSLQNPKVKRRPGKIKRSTSQIRVKRKAIRARRRASNRKVLSNRATGADEQGPTNPLLDPLLVHQTRPENSKALAVALR